MPNNPVIIKHKVCVIIAAAGKSSRMGLVDGMSKQFIKIGGKTVIEKTITVFNSCDYIDEIIIVSRDEDIKKLHEIIKSGNLYKVKDIVKGGETRQESVSNAVAVISADVDFIAIHDGARCFISHEDIEKIIKKAFETGAAAAGTKVTDTIKTVDENNNITSTINREYLRAVQTPQIFSKDLYISALKQCKENVTDDCAIVENAGYKVNIVECSKYNIKITDTQDLLFSDGFNREDKKSIMKIKTGHGYDVHRFGENRKLIIGGVEIPNNNIGLTGHSDADVLIHAVIDALLGAAGLGDIGTHFPDSDQKYKDISSVILLEKIVEIIKKDYIISNIDCTIILEKPKLGGYKEIIREKLSGVLGIDKSDINIKATTEEGLGFTGRKEGISTHAVCLLVGK